MRCCPKKKHDNTSRKKLKKRKKDAKKKTITVSTTDPDCGLFVKGDHKKQLAYEAHTACDVHGVVLAVEVTPGTVHDSVAFTMNTIMWSSNFRMFTPLWQTAHTRLPIFARRYFLTTEFYPQPTSAL